MEQDKDLSIESMVEELNDYCGGTLAITHYTKWSLNSYGYESFLCLDNFPLCIRHETFSGLIQKAYLIMKEDQSGVAKQYYLSAATIEEAREKISEYLVVDCNDGDKAEVTLSNGNKLIFIFDSGGFEEVKKDENL